MSPSRSTNNNYVQEVAAHKVVLADGRRMIKSRGQIYVGVDNGAGVLVKKAYFFNEEDSKIEAINLVFDTVVDGAEYGAAKAIKKSLQKYAVLGNPEGQLENEDAAPVEALITGDGSDSGIGFTGEAMEES